MGRDSPNCEILIPWEGGIDNSVPNFNFTVHFKCSHYFKKVNGGGGYCCYILHNKRIGFVLLYVAFSKKWEGAFGMGFCLLK